MITASPCGLMPDLDNRLKRLDLSDIHPLKRVILIGLRFMFALSLTAVLGLQFAWAVASVTLPLFHLSVMADKSCLQLAISWPAIASPTVNYLYGTYDGRSPNPRLEGRLSLAQISFIRIAPIPGLTVYRIYALPSTSDHLTINIYHLWLIGLTATFYLFTRWRIRRTARLQSMPS